MGKLYTLLSIFLFCLVSKACTQSPSNPLFVIEKQEKPTDQFDISLQMEEIEGGSYLCATIDLDKGTYVISPFSQDSFYLGFEIGLVSNPFLLKEKILLEHPVASTEMDPFIHKEVKYVRTNTTYKQQVKSLSRSNFEVNGLIEFLLEPACIPYDVHFMISQKEGVLKVKQLKTEISAEYKN